MKNSTFRNGLLSLVLLGSLFFANSNSVRAQEGFIGEIKMFAGNFAPRSWLFCQGQTLPISEYQALFSILGTQYGGDGRTTFNLPDLRGRVPVGTGRGPGLSDYRQGQQGGQETIVLTSGQLPVHNHPATGTLKAANIDPPDFANEVNPLGNNLGAPATGINIYTQDPATVNMAAENVTVTVGNTGSSQAVKIVQPYTSINYIICINGIYPSRN